jgi:cytochrome c553
MRAALIAVALLLGACGSPARPPDPERGRALFATPVESERGQQQACVRCHALGKDERSATGLGTNFYDIGLRAEREVSGQNAEQYLRMSIIDPDAHLAGGFQDGLMYRGYRTALTDEQIGDLVAYMVTLRGAP